jgi:hypothetical protein
VVIPDVVEKQKTFGTDENDELEYVIIYIKIYYFFFRFYIYLSAIIYYDLHRCCILKRFPALGCALPSMQLKDLANLYDIFPLPPVDTIQSFYFFHVHICVDSLIMCISLRDVTLSHSRSPKAYILCYQSPYCRLR